MSGLARASYSIPDRFATLSEQSLPFSTNAPSKSSMRSETQDQESEPADGPSPDTEPLSINDILSEFSVQGASVASASDADLAWLFRSFNGAGP